MALPLGDVNLVAVLVAAIVEMGLGAFWYSPSGFGRQWQQLSGISDATINAGKERGMGKTYAAAFVGTLVMAYVTAHVVNAFNAATLMDGAVVGFWMWLGFVATTMLGMILWESKPPKLYAINSGYYLVGLVVMGAILAMWG